MKRFIRYLYEYGQGRRLRNVGFVKVEQGSDDCVLHIHGKGLRLEEERSLKLYLICTEEENGIGIWQGDVERVNPAINYRMYYTREDTLRPEMFDRVCGMALVGSRGRVFAALWEDVGFDVEHLRLVDPRMEEYREQRSKQEPEESNTAGPEEAVQESKKEPEEKPEEVQPYANMREEDSVEAEQRREESRGADEEIHAEERADRGMRCTKIRREDLATLPRCEWKLSNNSFLLHGYYNYHHLMFLDDGEWLRLGVPGIYHVKEAKAAAAFGFPEFIRCRDLEMQSAEEDDTDFGYWCRCVKRQPGSRPCGSDL